MVRYKNRYVVAEINLPTKPADAPFALKPFIFHKTISSLIQKLHGDYGSAVTKGFATKYLNEITKIILIKVAHANYDIMMTTLPFVDKLDDVPVFLNTLYVGATMKQCFKFIRYHQQKRLHLSWSKLKTDEERQAFQEAVFNFKDADQNDITIR